VRHMNFICAVFSLLVSLCFSVLISQSYESDGVAKILAYRHCIRINSKSKSVKGGGRDKRRRRKWC